jgi:hypothetical protein
LHLRDLKGQNLTLLHPERIEIVQNVQSNPFAFIAQQVSIYETSFWVIGHFYQFMKRHLKIRLGNQCQNVIFSDVPGSFGTNS